MPSRPETGNASSTAAPQDPHNGFAENLKPTKLRTGTRAVNLNQPYAPIRKVDDEAQIPEIEMFVGESRVFPAPGVARIAVGNGSLLTAAALDNKEIILFANGAGTSSLFIWNADGRYQRVKISIVPGDTTRHAREIAAFLSTIPKAKASVVGANIIVEGDELSDADIAKIEELAKRYPQIVNFTNRIGWEQMVMLDVKVVEFPTTVLKDLGLKWTATGGAAVGGIWAPGSRGNAGPYEITIRTGDENKPPISASGGTNPLIPNGLNVLSYINAGLNAQLNLLAQEGKATLLAEPQLSTRSGSKASFVAGGEIPYSVQTMEGVKVQFKTYGVKLDIFPKVDHKGVIRATLQTEVSSVDRSVQTAAGPALLSRKTDTEFNLRAGETIVLSGLLQRELSSDVDKIPFLGDLPVIGALFRSKRYQNKETELVIFVTPTLVAASSAGNLDRIGRTTDRLQERMGDKPYLTEPLQPGVSYERPNVVPTRATENPVPQAIMPAAIQPMPVPVAPVSIQTGTSLPASHALSATRSSGGALLRIVSNGATLRTEPGLNTPAVMQLERGALVQLGSADARSTTAGDWRNVVVGSLSGWLLAESVEPARNLAFERAKDGKLLPQTGTQARRPLNTVPDRAAGKALTLDAAAPDARNLRVAADGLAMRLTPEVNGEIVARLIAGDTVVVLPQGSRGAFTAVQLGQGDTMRRGWVASQWLVPVTP